MSATGIQGLGKRVKRKEDPRFIRGKGNYIDDINLPGMLYLDIVRSPHAHAKILNIDTSKALAMPGVLAVITGKDLDAAGLAWMPTLMSDQQMVLPIDKVVYYAQEVAAVIATDRYTAADAVLEVKVDYEPLEVVVDPFKALDTRFAAGPRRPREEDQPHLALGGGEQGGDRSRSSTRPRSSSSRISTFPASTSPRSRPAAAWSRTIAISGKLTIYMTSQAPHAHRTVFSLVSGIPETQIRIISPDIGGGFGGKVPVYPGYVLATVAAITTGKPVKWIEDRSENLQADSFARDYHIHAELAADKDGKMRAMRVKTLADHGAFDAAANPSKFPAGLFSICTGSYNFEKAHVEVDGVYTNKAPGGVAYRCSFRVTEAVHTIERMVDVLADELNMDAAEIRMKNFIKPEQFPYKSPTGWEYDSGNYQGALHKALDGIGYQELLREQAEKRARGELMGIGISTFTEIVGAGPSHTFDILGIKMFDSAEIRVHPTGSAIVRIGVQTQGQGHETTFAQIVAEELGSAGREDHRRAWRYRHRPLRPRHLRQPQHANRRRGDRRRGPQDPRKGSPAGGSPARMQPRRPGMVRLRLPRQGLARAVQDDDRARFRRLHQLPAGARGRARSRHLLRSAESDLPVRRLHLPWSTSIAAPGRSRSANSWRSTTAARSSTR